MSLFLQHFQDHRGPQDAHVLPRRPRRSQSCGGEESNEEGVCVCVHGVGGAGRERAVVDWYPEDIPRYWAQPWLRTQARGPTRRQRQATGGERRGPCAVHQTQGEAA